MRDPHLAARNMQLLRVAGVRFAIDDFGTGHSSLSQLNMLPVDELKIDRSFITHARLGSDTATIVTSTIELGHSMGLEVVAEGVEEPEAWNLLRQLGCDFAQGYLISRPLARAGCAGVRAAGQPTAARLRFHRRCRSARSSSSRERASAASDSARGSSPALRRRARASRKAGCSGPDPGSR